MKIVCTANRYAGAATVLSRWLSRSLVREYLDPTTVNSSALRSVQFLLEEACANMTPPYRSEEFKLVRGVILLLHVLEDDGERAMLDHGTADATMRRFREFLDGVERPLINDERVLAEQLVRFFTIVRILADSQNDSQAHEKTGEPVLQGIDEE